MDNPRIQLYQSLLKHEDPEVRKHFGSISAKDFESRILNDNQYQKDLFDDLQSIGIVTDENQFRQQYIDPPKAGKIVTGPPLKTGKATTTAPPPAPPQPKQEKGFFQKYVAPPIKLGGAIAAAGAGAPQLLTEAIPGLGKTIGLMSSVEQPKEEEYNYVLPGGEPLPDLGRLERVSVEYAEKQKQYTDYQNLLKSGRMERLLKNTPIPIPKDLPVEEKEAYFKRLLPGYMTPAEIKQYQKLERDKTQAEAEIVPKMAPLVDKIVERAMRDATNSYTKDNRGRKIINEAYVINQARNAAVRAGAKAGSYVEFMLTNSIKSKMAFKELESEINREFYAEYKKKYGAYLPDEISAEQKAQIDAQFPAQKQAQLKYDNSAAELRRAYAPKNKELEQTYMAAVAKYRKDIEQDSEIQAKANEYDAPILQKLQEAVNSGEITVAQAKEYISSPQAKKQRQDILQRFIDEKHGAPLAAAYNTYLRDKAQLNNRYNATLRRVGDEIENEFENRYKAFADKFQKEGKYKMSPALMAKMEKVYEAAYNKVFEKKGLKTRQEDLDASIYSNFLSATMKGLGEGISSTAFTLGMEDVQAFGDIMASQFQTSDLNIESWKDFSLSTEGATRVANNFGQILGRMAPGLGTGAATAFATGGFSIPTLPAMLLSAVPSAAMETLDIMGSTSREALMAKGGSIAKAKIAETKALEGQLKTAPAYLLDGLPFFSKVITVGRRIKNIPLRTAYRTATGMGINLTTELLQEFPQDVFNKAIVEGRDPTMKLLVEDFTAQKVADLSATLLPTSIFMGGAPQLGSGFQEAGALVAAKNYYAKNILSNASHPGLLQQNQSYYLNSLSRRKGEAFATQMLGVLLNKGNITKSQADVLAQKLDLYNKFRSQYKIKNSIQEQAAFLLYSKYIEAKNSKNTQAEQQTLDAFKKFIEGGEADLIMLSMPGGDNIVYTYDDFNSLLDNKDFQNASRTNSSSVYSDLFYITPFAPTQIQSNNSKLNQILERFDVIKSSEDDTVSEDDKIQEDTRTQEEKDKDILAGQQRTGYKVGSIIASMPVDFRAVLDAVMSGETDVTPEEIEQTMRYFDGTLRILRSMPQSASRNLTIQQIDAAIEEVENAQNQLQGYAQNLSFNEEEQQVQNDLDQIQTGGAAPGAAAPTVEPPTQEQVAADQKTGQYGNVTFEVGQAVPDYLQPYMDKAVRFRKDGKEFIQIVVPASLAQFYAGGGTTQAAPAVETAVETATEAAPVVEPTTEAAPVTEEPVEEAPQVEEMAPESETEPATPKPKARVNLFTDSEVVSRMTPTEKREFEKLVFSDEDKAAEFIKNKRTQLLQLEIELRDIGSISEFIQKSFENIGIDIKIADKDEFVRLLKEAGESASRNQEGAFDDKTGKIYINRDAIKTGWGTTVIWHEAIHPIMNIIHNSNKPLYDKIHRGILANAKANPKGGMQDVINDVERIYTNEKGYNDASRKDEIIVEALARLAAGTMSFSELQPTLRQQFIDLINRIGRMLGFKQAEVSDMRAIKDLAKKISKTLKEGKDISVIVGKENVKKFQRPETLSGAQLSIDGRLSEPGIDVPEKEILPKKVSESKEQKTFKRIDDLLDRYPDALTDKNQWKELMSRVFPYKGPNGEVYIPAYPEGLGRMAKSPQAIIKELKIVSDEQRKLASEGIEKTKEIGDLFKQGKMDEVDTGLYFLWNIMSIGISPYPQEAGFLRAVNNGIDEFIQKAADGKFLTGKEVTITDIDEDGKTKKVVVDQAVVDFYKWVDETLIKDTPGSGSKANLRAFGRNFLTKASQEIKTGEFAGMTRLQALHAILSDRTTPTNKLRRKWQANMSAMSFNNKIFDFILLTTGRSDLFVIDRVRTEHFWDAKKLKKERGLSESTSIYDGKELKYGETASAGYSKMLSDVAGLVFAELANRTMQPIVKKAYEKIGVKDSPDVGRFHWETWVAASSQEVSHGSIDAIVQRKKAGEIQDAGIRQGKYGSWDFNFSYRKLAGEPFRFEFKDDNNNTYVFDDILDVQDEINKQNTKKTYSSDSERFILKDKDGKIIKRKTKDIGSPWYEQEGVDKQKYFNFLRSKAKEVIPAPDVIEDQGVVIGMPEGSGENVKKLQPSLGGREKAGTFEPGKENEKEQRIRPERAGDGGVRNIGGGEAPLAGAPVIQGATGPIQELVQVAKEYAKKIGIPFLRQAEYVQADPARGKRIADEYAEMKHDPTNPKVKESYADLIKQTKAQYQALVDAGYEFTFFDENTDPYDGNPFNAMRDLRANKKMAVYGTYDGYGTEGVTKGEVENNPMLEDTGLRWPDQNGVMHPVLANDLFRAVHDAFGHGLEGASFRARGEENAWQSHVRLFTGPAVAAITSETRGQNSWLNFNTNLLVDAVGKERAKELHPDNWETITVGEHNRNAKVNDTIFADQKTGIMPEWTWTEGRASDMEEAGGAQASLGGRAEKAFSSIDKALDMPPVKSKAARAALVDEYGKEAVDQMIEITRNFTKIIDGLEEKGVVKKDCP